MAEQLSDSEEDINDLFNRDKELSQEIRTQIAIKTFREASAEFEAAINNPNIGKKEAISKKPSQRNIARKHGIDHSTLSRRLRGQQSREERAVEMQKVKPKEEEAIEQQIIQLDRWNFPPRVTKVRWEHPSMGT
ncbi:MAG: hypothetical protein Q9167_008130, partial [Letrouitia subvulpina]